MLVGTEVRRVAIVGGVRIPFARGMGAYFEAGNQEMLTAAFRGVVDRFGLQGERLGDVAAGAVMKHSSQWNLVRECVLASGLAPETPGMDLQRACGTSLEAAIGIANKIALGQIEAGMAGGVDTVSDAPIVYPRSYQQLLLRSAKGRSLGEKLRPWLGLRPKHFRPVVPGTLEPRTGLSMGQSCEIMAKTWRIAREDQDRLAYESHARAARAWAEGFHADLVVPFMGLQRDDNVRADTSLEKLAKEIAESRAQLRTETERLEQLIARRPASGAEAGATTPATPAAPPAAPLKNAELDALAKTMKSMKPEAAALLLQKSDTKLAAALLKRMKPAEAGAVMDRLKPDLAAELVATMATMPGAPGKGALK